MSLDAMVATAWAQRHPDEIERLVLINTSMRPYARVYEHLRPSAWRMPLRIVAHWRDTQQCEQLIYRLTCHRTDTFDTDVAQWSTFRQTHGASASNAPRCPALLLASARIARQWHASHAVHAWAGHDLPHDDADWTCEAIATWLAQDRYDNRNMHAPHSMRV